MANSSSVVEEGDEGLRKKSQRNFVCEGGSGCLILHARMPDQGGRSEKKFHGQGKLSQSPGGGMKMLDGCAGLGEHGRKKRQIEMSSADKSYRAGFGQMGNKY